MSQLKGLKFAFLSHESEGATGYPDILGEYLRKSGARLAHLRFPFFISNTKSIWIEHYDGETLVSRRRSWIRFYKPQILSYAKDFMWLMLVGWRDVAGSDFVIATNCLMGLAALIFRRLGLIRRYTLMLIDFSPVRFSNPLIERIYVFLDSYVSRNADSLWPIKASMLDGRVDAGRIKRDQVPFFEAPMGTYSHIIFADGEPAYNKRDLVYVGATKNKNVRADFLLEVGKVLRDRGEKFRLIFVGPGATQHLEEMAKKLNIMDCAVFKGSIPDLIDLERFVATCGIGLAPYDPYWKENFSQFADPGKIKNYLGCGVPVVSTEVPPIAKELQAQGAGVIADMQPGAFADAIQRYWNDEATYKKARKQARRMGEQFTWPSIFDRLMEQEGLISNKSQSA